MTEPYDDEVGEDPAMDAATFERLFAERRIHYSEKLDARDFRAGGRVLRLGHPLIPRLVIAALGALERLRP